MQEKEYRIRKELKRIHPDLDVRMSSQGRQWVDYWLVDKSKKIKSTDYDEPLISYSDEYKNYIGAYSEEDFNKMLDFFKKWGQKYIDTGKI